MTLNTCDIVSRLQGVTARRVKSALHYNASRDTLITFILYHQHRSHTYDFFFYINGSMNVEIEG